MVRGAFLVAGQDGLFLVGDLKNQELRGGPKAQRVAVVDAYRRAGLCRFAAKHGLLPRERFCRRPKATWCRLLSQAPGQTKHCRA